MNEEKPFAGENPFRKLDKKRFPSHDEKKKAKSLKKTSLSPAMTVQLPLFIRNSSRLRMKAKPEPF